jgi:hypothetical protein
MDWLKKYLLSTAMRHAPPDTPVEGDDERIPEPDLDDDETVTDPVGETDEPEGDDDDQDDDADGDDDAGGEQPPERQTRGDRQTAALRADRRRLAEENARITRELEQMRNRPPAAPAAPVETPAQRAERMALMSPDERTEAIISEALQRNNQQNQQLTARILDQSDKTAFDMRAEQNPLFKKLAHQVEQELVNLRARGQDLPRESIAIYLIGQRVVAQQGKAKPGVKERRRAQESRPANGRGDVQGNRRERQRGGDTAADIERRYGDVPI